MPNTVHKTQPADNGRAASRTREPGHFYCINDSLIPWRLVLSRMASAVYDLLAFRANDAMECWWGQRRLAEALGRNERTVRRGLDELEGYGLIEVQHRQRKTSMYRLLAVPAAPVCPLKTAASECPIKNLDRTISGHLDRTTFGHSMRRSSAAKPYPENHAQEKQPDPLPPARKERSPSGVLPPSPPSRSPLAGKTTRQATSARRSVGNGAHALNGHAASLAEILVWPERDFEAMLHSRKPATAAEVEAFAWLVDCYRDVNPERSAAQVVAEQLRQHPRFKPFAESLLRTAQRSTIAS